jgi:archaellum component FlaC
VQSITNRLDQTEERGTGIENKVEAIIHSESNLKKQKNKYDHNLQELWDTIKKLNLRIHGVGEEAGISKGIKTYSMKL